jgi:membrane fusion protein (multidrug efflux system)
MIAERAAAVANAEAEARRAQADLERYESLAARGFAAEQRLQTTRAAADQAVAKVAQARAALEAERRSAASLGSTKQQTLAQAAQATATVQQARINLDRTVIRAPVSGVIGARGVRPRPVRPAGRQLMSIVPAGRDLHRRQLQGDADGSASAGPAGGDQGRRFRRRRHPGRVESFAPATGSEFALIPVENAVGNFTKVVQRLPVRIAVDKGDKLAGALRPGFPSRSRST